MPLAETLGEQGATAELVKVHVRDERRRIVERLTQELLDDRVHVQPLALRRLGALAIGAIAIAGTMDKPLVEADVFVVWLLAAGVQWLLYEPAGLLAYACLTLLLKWCTSFEDLPEVKEEKMKLQKQQEMDRKAQMASEKTPPTTQLVKATAKGV